MFELHQLEQLIAVAECKTLSAAAEKLHLSQPALSRSMQKLEAELQVPLFTRHKNKIELNENAKMAVDYARKILWQSRDMMEHLRAFDLSRRTIRVGSCAPMPMWDVLPVLSSLYPAMTISSEIKEEEALLQGLLDGTYQFVFLPYEITENGIQCKKYMEEHLFFSLPPGHALSGRKVLHLRDLNGETMLLYSDIGFWKKALEKEMPETHFLVQTEFSTFHELVKASVLPSFITNLAIKKEEETSNRINIPIADLEASATFYLACSPETAKTYRKFLQYCFSD